MSLYIPSVLLCCPNVRMPDQATFWYYWSFSCPPKSQKLLLPHHYDGLSQWPKAMCQTWELNQQALKIYDLLLVELKDHAFQFIQKLHMNHYPHKELVQMGNYNLLKLHLLYLKSLFRLIC